MGKDKNFEDKVVSLFNGTDEQKEIKDSTDKITQTGNGNNVINNQQGSGDIINHFNEPQNNDNNPNQMECPSCFQPVSKLASICPRNNCGANIAEYLMTIKIRERNSEIKKGVFLYFIPSFALILLGVYLSLPSLMLTGVAALGMYILYNKLRN